MLRETPSIATSKRYDKSLRKCSAARCEASTQIGQGEQLAPKPDRLRHEPRSAALVVAVLVGVVRKNRVEMFVVAKHLDLYRLCLPDERSEADALTGVLSHTGEACQRFSVVT